MTGPSETISTRLAEDLRASGARAIETLRRLPGTAFAEGRYENGWSAREILAHLAAIEWTYPRLLDLATGTARAEQGHGPGGEARGGIDAYNARQVAKRATASIDELLDEFEQNRAALVAAVETADPALFDLSIRSAGGRTGTLAQVLREVAILHVEGHVADITGDRS